jgi:hypothetical protein
MQYAQSLQHTIYLFPGMIQAHQGAASDMLTMFMYLLPSLKPLFVRTPESMASYCTMLYT